MPSGVADPVAYEPQNLADWLEKARASALRAQASEDRTRQSLYAAIGRAWDFALAAQTAPDDYARLLAEAGLVAQDRAPLIPLVKLVFGTDYDKTRLTEYATVLGHARRLGLGTGELADLLGQTEGGIKALVSRERAAKRGEASENAQRKPWQATARALPARPLAELSRDGAEFALVLVRRTPDGDPAMLGEISDDAALLARAARHFIDG
jgi:GNAT superfamily N-acetyltransferase